MVRDIAFFIALMAAALAFGAALAHALELPNKIGLPASEYFIAQKSYRGWDRLAFLLVLELASMVAVAALYWSDRPVRWPVLAGIGCLLAAQTVFWSFTFPANSATSNWTVIPENWQQLRRNWEYSHLAGAIFQRIAMAALIVAVLSRRA